MTKIKNVLKNIILANLNGVDLLAGIVFSVFWGYSVQTFADSSQVNNAKILISILTGVISYLIAYICSIPLRKINRLPSWVWITVLGSGIFAFSRQVIVYLINNWTYRKSDSIYEYVIWLLPDLIRGFLFGLIIFVFLALCLTFTFRFFVCSLQLLFRESEGRLK